MKTEAIKINRLFKTEEALSILPEEIKISHALNLNKADIDVVISGYRFPELTNAVVKNYLYHEKDALINMIVVESSGDLDVFNKLIAGDRVSRVLVHDFRTVHPLLGSASYGMAISSAIGSFLSSSEHVFFSHSDMWACKDNFLSFLRSKLSTQIRLASFTQRHIIPFSGCMLLRRSLLDEPDIDWMVYDTNNFMNRNAPLIKINESGMLSNLMFLDCGEAFIFSELAHNNPVYVCASRGGSDDFWKEPVACLSMESKAVYKIVQSSGCPIIYAPLCITKDTFKSKYRYLLKIAQSGFFDFKNRKFWRYSFDDDGELIFIHHGRGTSTRRVKNWLKFINMYSDREQNGNV